MSSDDHMQPLFNALPPVVVALALAIFGVELLISAGARGYIGGPEAVGWRLEAIREFAFFSPVLEFVIERQAWMSPELRRFVTYPFIHLGFAHVIFVIVFLLALGKLVGEVFGNLAVLIVFFGSAIFGALIFAGLTGDSRPLVGGYPGVYGLIGAYTFLLWVSYGVTGENQYRAFTLIGFLMGIQFIFGFLFGSTNDWVAEIAGFLVGFAISPMLVPGGFRRLLNRLRQR
ncbi:rhomboid family intramembrane serine protease [Silicimonas sp. MF1-12-2]|jgi:rhomboid protease GluP|uniref:rhomboid family intramembrane serine protease n=1 Tax=Silicimonas sp. MF1-12-2 TaxID=3384793 RepID=UPI0039B3CBFD